MVSSTDSTDGAESLITTMDGEDMKGRLPTHPGEAPVPDFSKYVCFQRGESQ